jgi:Cu+-exporting ATPase
LPTSLVAYEKQETSLGRTIIFVALVSPKKVQPQLVLAVSLADSPRPSSRHAVRSLEKMGIEVNMMTGDSKMTALAVAKQVGIRPEGVWASMSPKGKAAMVTELIETYGGGVAMVCHLLLLLLLLSKCR